MIGRKSVLILVSRLTAAALSLVGLMFMTRYLGPDVYGGIAWMLAVIMTYAQATDLGFSSAHIKRVSEGVDIDDCVSTYAMVRTLLTLLMVGLVVLSLWIYTDVLDEEVVSFSVEVLLLFLLFRAIFNMANIATFTFEARTKMAKANIAYIADPFVRVPVLILLLVVGLGDVGVALAYIAGATALLIVSFLLLRGEGIEPRRPTQFRSYLRFAAPMAVIAIIAAVSGNLDRIIVGAYWSADDVGFFASGKTFLASLLIIGQSVNSVTFPTFSRMHSEGDMRTIRVATRQAERYLSLIMTPIILFLVVFPHDISAILFGADFRPAGASLRWLAMGTLISMLNIVYQSQLLAVDRPDLSAKINLLYFLLNIGFLLLLVPGELYGVPLPGMSFEGAAIAYLLSLVFTVIATRVVVWRITGTASNWRIGLHAIGAAVAAAVLLGVETIFPLNGWLALILFAALTEALFLLSLVPLGEFGKGDVRYFLDLVDPRKMRDYVRSEFDDSEE